MPLHHQPVRGDFSLKPIIGLFQHVLHIFHVQQLLHHSLDDHFTMRLPGHPGGKRRASQECCQNNRVLFVNHEGLMTKRRERQPLDLLGERIGDRLYTHNSGDDLGMVYDVYRNTVIGIPIHEPA
jgi:hypothetical protein